jgi:hypothetical protein
MTSGPVPTALALPGGRAGTMRQRDGYMRPRLRAVYISPQPGPPRMPTRYLGLGVAQAANRLPERRDPARA